MKSKPTMSRTSSATRRLQSSTSSVRQTETSTTTPKLVPSMSLTLPSSSGSRRSTVSHHRASARPAIESRDTSMGLPSQASARRTQPKKSRSVNALSDTSSITSTPATGKAHSDVNRRGSFQRDSPALRSTKSDGANLNGKQDKFLSAKKAIEALDKSLGTDKRIATIANTCAEFDHWDEAKHNAELMYGAANIFTLILSMTEDHDEIRMICAATEMVFRSSQQSVFTAFERVGFSLLPMLLRLLDRCEKGEVKHGDVCILNITKTLLYFSRVPELRAPLVKFHGMLDALQRVSMPTLNADCRFLRMRLFANLAHCDDNKVVIVDYPGLLGSLLRTAALDTSENTREYAAAALMDLASARPNQPRMAKMDKLLGTLVKLAVLEHVAETRESSITALQNLAYCKENRIRLVSYGSGVVLEALKKTIGSDTNDKARRRAAGALTNLACEETAEYMGSHKGLLETLAVVSTKDENADVQGRASMALTKIAASITADMPCHMILLDALAAASTSDHATTVSAVLRMKARDPENRVSLAHHPGILDTLLDLTSSQGHSVQDRDNAMRAIMHLTNEPANHKLLCSKMVLKALVEGASVEFSKEHEIPESAITALERLATDFSNRPHMARHDGLLTAVAKATEREAKLEAAGQATFEGHPRFLAKPLLMSLLLAM